MKRKTLSTAGISVLLVMSILGTTLFGTTGCDADVQLALVSGLNAAATGAVSAIIQSNPEGLTTATSAAINAVINAAFLSITPDHGENGAVVE